MANWKDLIEKKASFVKSSRMTMGGGLDETLPRNWYDRRVYEKSTGHQDPVKAVNDEMYRDWQRREAEKKQRWEETKKKWSGAFRQIANTMSQTDASPGGGYENVAAKNDAIVGEPAVRAIGSAIGAGSGFLMGQYDQFKRNPFRYLMGMRNGGFNNLLNTFDHGGNEGLPGIMDFVSAGAKAGWQYAPQLASGMATGAKNTIPDIAGLFGPSYGKAARRAQKAIGFDQAMDAVRKWEQNIVDREEAEDTATTDALVNASWEDLADPYFKPLREMAEREELRSAVREGAEPAGASALFAAGAMPMGLAAKPVQAITSVAKNPWIRTIGPALSRSAPWMDMYLDAGGALERQRKNNLEKALRDGRVPADMVEPLREWLAE